MISNNTPPQFPVGEFKSPGDYDEDLKDGYTELLAEAPEKIRTTVKGLNDEQLDTKYKNWTVRQIIHHLADSHMNAFIRFKWTLTEESPLIKAYDETKWSEVVGARTLPIESSLSILDGLHARWAGLISNLDMDSMRLTYFHPELGHEVSLLDALPSYIWHTDHHCGQIDWLRDQNQW
jgi:hypothetical protein